MATNNLKQGHEGEIPKIPKLEFYEPAEPLEEESKQTPTLSKTKFTKDQLCVFLFVLGIGLGFLAGAYVEGVENTININGTILNETQVIDEINNSLIIGRQQGYNFCLNEIKNLNQIGGNK